MDRCKKQHILFDEIDNANTNYKAIGVYCGQMLEDERVWYCSEECMEKGEEGKPLKYKKDDNEISID